MATALYDFGRQSFLLGDIDWVADDIRAILIDAADYTVNFATHQYLSDIPLAARVSVTSSLTSKTATAGVADAADPVFATVTGDQCEAIVLYKHTGTAGTSILIAYIDNYIGLPVTPNGSNISLAFPNDANKIFKL